MYLFPDHHHELAHLLSSHQFTCLVAQYFPLQCCLGLSSQPFKWIRPIFFKVKEIRLHLPTVSLDVAKWIPGVMPRPSTNTNPLLPLNVNMHAIIQKLSIEYPHVTGPGFYILAVLLTLEHAWGSPREILKHKFLDLPPRAINSVCQRWDLDWAFLISSQLVLMLPVHGPHLEEHCFRDYKGEEQVELTSSI